MDGLWGSKIGAIPSTLECSTQLVVQRQSRPNGILSVEPLFQKDIYLEKLVIVRGLVMHSNPVQGRDAEIVSVILTDQSADWQCNHDTLTGQSLYMREGYCRNSIFRQYSLILSQFTPWHLIPDT